MNIVGESIFLVMISREELKMIVSELYCCNRTDRRSLLQYSEEELEMSEKLREKLKEELGK